MKKGCTVSTMVAILILVTVVAIVALFGLAALRWGVDTSAVTSDPREPAQPSI